MQGKWRCFPWMRDGPARDQHSHLAPTQARSDQIGATDPLSAAKGSPARAGTRAGRYRTATNPSGRVLQPVDVLQQPQPGGLGHIGGAGFRQFEVVPGAGLDEACVLVDQACPRRPVPFGLLGAALDKALMHRLATMTVAALLTELADATANPATAAEPGQQAAMLNPEE